MSKTYTNRLPISLRDKLVRLAAHCITKNGIPAYVGQNEKECWLASDDTITGLSSQCYGDSWPRELNAEQRLYWALAELGEANGMYPVNLYRVNRSKTPTTYHTIIIPRPGLPIVFDPMELPVAVREAVVDAHMANDIQQDIANILRDEAKLDEKGTNKAPLCGRTPAASILADPKALYDLASHLDGEMRPNHEKLVDKIAEYFEEQDSYSEEE